MTDDREKPLFVYRRKYLLWNAIYGIQGTGGSGKNGDW